MIAAARPSLTSVSAKRRVRRGDRDVGGRDDADAARTHRSGDLGHDGLGQRQELALEGHDRPGALLHAAGGRLGQVGAGAEHPARRADQHHAYVVVGTGRRDVPDQLGHQLPGQGVAVVRRVEGDGRDRPVDVEVDELGGRPGSTVGHVRHHHVWPTTQELADRLRDQLEGTPTTEQRMFGGLAFLVGGNMAVAASSKGGLMVRCAPEDTDDPPRRRRHAVRDARQADGRLAAGHRRGGGGRRRAGPLGAGRRRPGGGPPAQVGRRSEQGA